MYSTIDHFFKALEDNPSYIYHLRGGGSNQPFINYFRGTGDDLQKILASNDKSVC